MHEDDFGGVRRGRRPSGVPSMRAMRVGERDDRQLAREDRDGRGDARPAVPAVALVEVREQDQCTGTDQ